MPAGLLVLETGVTFAGEFAGLKERAGEVVFNTSHSGYEEMATDPSYFNQILVTTTAELGNYGVDRSVWESKQLFINGFICLDMQKSKRDSSWLSRLQESGVAVLTGVDTRRLTLKLREQGTVWGAIVRETDVEAAKKKASGLIREAQSVPRDWTAIVSRKKPEDIKGLNSSGPRVAVLDFGAKENILRELQTRVKELRVFPSETSAEEILKWQPQGVMLTNGPGDPADVKAGIETVRNLLGRTVIFGICMGHQVLALALGGRTYKLKFGHRGSNHPIQDKLLGRVYVTSQNHGYNVDQESLPQGVKVTHINLNDQTVAGLYYPEKRCFSVQFHPESHPGPHDAVGLFDYFVRQLQ